MLRTRLNLKSPQLADQIAKATVDMQRLICVKVCKLVLGRTGLDDAVARRALERLETGKYDDGAARSNLEKLAESLDDRYLTAKDLYEEGKGSKESYRALFSKARSADALLVSFNDNAFTAAGEAVYEASAAIGNDEVESLVRRLLAEDR